MNVGSHIVSFDGVGYFKALQNDRKLGIVLEPTHERIEIVLEGYGYCELRDESDRKKISQKSERVGPGSIIWHIEGDKTLKDADARNPYRCMFYRYTVKAGNLFSPRRISRWNDLSECKAFCWETFSQYHQKTCPNDIIGSYVYSRIIWEVNRDINRRVLDSVPVMLKKIMKAVEEKPGNDWSVGQLGQIADISESHVYLIFRNHLKVSPHDYVLMHRLNKSKELLITTNLRIKEICGLCGFINSAHFIRLFRNRFSITPKIYREKYANIK